MKDFIYSLPRNILKSFGGFNIIWHIAAIIITYILVVTNIDWQYFVATRNPILVYSFFPAVILGGLLPILIPLSVLIVGYVSRKRGTILAGWALAQAALIGSLISSVYKAFTGRVQPNLHEVTTNISRNFQFGFFKHGIFWGWPSSHTTIAFAMAIALIQIFPKHKTLIAVSLVYALYIGIGVSLSIHWLSEAISGALIGTVIGLTVGKYFRGKIKFTV